MRNRGYSTADVVIGMFSTISGIAIVVSELEFSVKVTAAIAWLLTMAWGAIALKISAALEKMKTEMIEHHIMPIRSDINDIKVSLRGLPCGEVKFDGRR